MLAIEKTRLRFEANSSLFCWFQADEKKFPTSWNSCKMQIYIIVQGFANYRVFQLAKWSFHPGEA